MRVHATPSQAAAIVRAMTWGDDGRSLRLRLEFLGGHDNGARRARAPLSRPSPGGRRRGCRRSAGGLQADRV